MSNAKCKKFETLIMNPFESNEDCTTILKHFCIVNYFIVYSESFFQYGDIKQVNIFDFHQIYLIIVFICA